MTKTTLVSILIPLYNAEKYFAKTIESILNQTYEHIEVIIVDDGSTDNSLKIAKQLEGEFSQIKVYSQENKGASSARNKAFKLSKGEYIQYLDADDILHMDKILTQVQYLKKYEEKVVSFGKCGKFQNDIGNAVFYELSVNKNYLNTKRFLTDIWLNLEAVYLHSWLTPRTLIEAVGEWNENLTNNDDGEFFSRIVALANQLVYVNDSIVYYRTDSENSLSKGNSEKSQISNLKSYETYYNLMQNRIKDPIVRKALAMVYSNFIYTIYPQYNYLRQEAEKKINSLGFQTPFFNKKRNLYYLAKCIGFNNTLKFNYMYQKIRKKIKND